MKFPTHIVSAGAFVENDKGEVLLVKTRDDGWVYPGGIVEVGENVIDGVLREVKEESGIVAEVSHLVTIISNTVIHKWHDGETDVPTKVMFDFVCKVVGGQLATSDETSEVIWVNKEDALNYITLLPIQLRYEAYLNFNGQVNFIEYTTSTTKTCDVVLEMKV